MKIMQIKLFLLIGFVFVSPIFSFWRNNSKAKAIEKFGIAFKKMVAEQQDWKSVPEISAEIEWLMKKSGVKDRIFGVKIIGNAFLVEARANNGPILIAVLGRTDGHEKEIDAYLKSVAENKAKGRELCWFGYQLINDHGKQ